MTIKRRAVTEQQKHQRRQALLDSAWMLFQARPYEDITISEVAEAAGLAKGTVYLYFQTREELFLAIQEQQFAAWFDDVDQRLAAVSGEISIPQVADMLCGSLDRRPDMIRLFAILHPVLEQNVGYEPVLAFKQAVFIRIMTTSALLQRCLPFLTLEESARFFMWAYALVIGLQQLAQPAPVVRQVFAHAPELAVFNPHFGSECAAVITAMLSGLQAAAQQRKTASGAGNP